MSEISKCNAQETAACCCVDVGTIIDNTDCTANFNRVFASKAEAEQMLETLIAKARKTESDPCEITHTLNNVDDGVELDAKFTFCCEAELLIFQLGLR